MLRVEHIQAWLSLDLPIIGQEILFKLNFHIFFLAEDCLDSAISMS